MRKYYLLNGPFLFVLFAGLLGLGCVKIYVKNSLVTKGYRLAELKDEELSLHTSNGILSAKLEQMLQKDHLNYLANAMPTKASGRNQIALVKF